MGLIEVLARLLFGRGRNVLRETTEVFRPNADAMAARDADRTSAALAQFGAEFAPLRRGRFDRAMDALNRVPRPAMALGTLAMFAAAMFDPVWFSARATRPRGTISAARCASGNTTCTGSRRPKTWRRPPGRTAPAPPTAPRTPF